jgi:hypothetical protein
VIRFPANHLGSHQENIPQAATMNRRTSEKRAFKFSGFSTFASMISAHLVSPSPHFPVTLAQCLAGSKLALK